MAQDKEEAFPCSTQQRSEDVFPDIGIIWHNNLVGRKNTSKAFEACLQCDFQGHVVKDALMANGELIAQPVCIDVPNNCTECNCIRPGLG